MINASSLMEDMSRYAEQDVKYLDHLYVALLPTVKEMRLEEKVFDCSRGRIKDAISKDFASTRAYVPWELTMLGRSAHQSQNPYESRMMAKILYGL